MAVVLHLVAKPPEVDAATIETFERLLAEARAGRIVGAAYIALTPACGYEYQVVGECRSYPTLSRGMVRSLDDDLALLIRQTSK